jgi:L-iditol 2-dehydrogenase
MAILGSRYRFEPIKNGFLIGDKSKESWNRMKAILIEKPGSFRIIEQPIPQPNDDEIVIQVKAATLCNQHDCKVWTGGYKKLEYLEYGIPGFPGHEAAGKVVKTGFKVQGFTVGDRVVLSGLGGPPLYQEYVTRNSSEVVTFSDELSYEEVAMSELLGCVHRGFEKVKNWTGKTVLVVGLGPAGLGAVQLAKIKGAAKVIGIDLLDNRLSLAKLCGVDLALNATHKNIYKWLKTERPEIVYETTGDNKSYSNSVKIAGESVILFGYSESDIILDPYPIFDKELAILGSKWLAVENLKAVVKLIEDGKLRTRPMISAEFSFENYPKAVEMIQKKKAIKVVLKP